MTWQPDDEGLCIRCGRDPWHCECGLCPICRIDKTHTLRDNGEECFHEEKNTFEEARKKCRCPYRQDLEILCFEPECGKGNSSDCPIFLKESGLLAKYLYQQGG